MGLCPTMEPSTPFVQRPSFACRINQLPARKNWPCSLRPGALSLSLCLAGRAPPQASRPRRSFASRPGASPGTPAPRACPRIRERPRGYSAPGAATGGSNSSSPRYCSSVLTRWATAPDVIPSSRAALAKLWCRPATSKNRNTSSRGRRPSSAGCSPPCRAFHPYSGRTRVGHSAGPRSRTRTGASPSSGNANWMKSWSASRVEESGTSTRRQILGSIS